MNGRMRKGAGFGHLAKYVLGTLGNFTHNCRYLSNREVLLFTDQVGALQCALYLRLFDVGMSRRATDGHESLVYCCGAQHKGSPWPKNISCLKYRENKIDLVADL